MKATKAQTEKVLLKLVGGKDNLTRDEISKAVGLPGTIVSSGLQTLKAEGKVKEEGPSRTMRWKITGK